MFDGEDFFDTNNLNFTYNFTTYWKTFETLMITTIGANFPGVIIDAYYINKSYVLFLYCFNFLSAVIIFGIFAGGCGNNFLALYNMSLRKIAH